MQAAQRRDEARRRAAYCLGSVPARHPRAPGKLRSRTEKQLAATGIFRHTRNPEVHA